MNTLRSFLFGAALALCPLAAQADHWTAVASTGAMDESAAGIFQFNGPSLSYLGGGASLLPIVARYNVTNTSGTELPAWNTLELGYLDLNATGAVQARLIQVRPCNGAQQVLCTVVSADNTAATCRSCTFANQVDFANFLYYVEVTLTRQNAATNPAALTLRVF
ncbi:MAG TPA: hypothetical protein VEG34_11260 [Thermoanaerobaculia bacterium]|nr:hypothetical protein [Thermoanaerobaculia bacterium]